MEVRVAGPSLDRETPARLGAVPDADGTGFTLFSAHATAVDLCLFDPGGTAETRRIGLARLGRDLWHAHVPGIRAGQHYGYRIHGPYDPAQGHRFNPNKLVLDPYTRLVAGEITYRDEIYGYRRSEPAGFTSFDARDDAAFKPRSVVVEDPAPVAHARPSRPWRDTVVYEAHVRGLTRLHPEIPEAIRGTYEALGHPALVEHMLRLGVTALELLPIHAIADEPALFARGLVNFWGYSTLGYFAPAPRYFGPNGAEGLRDAIRSLHAAGIEVILDVVYNHSAEGEEDGPTLSLRCIDSASYYSPVPGDPGRLWNATGCGNTLNIGHPRVRQLAIDSLRHWAESYGVDGFRFDLAPVMGRENYRFDPNAAFFREVAADPVLGPLKMIAEPWDLGENGYRLGQFPPPFAEWNDGVRDTVRRFWRGDPGQLPRLVQAFAGSEPIFAASGRGPLASVNYVASHDGFTLSDVTRYARKHNEANGEGNRDGHEPNLSDNHGVEGDTDDPAIRAARARTARALLASVLLAQGVPMLLAGDELSRSQRGNNNAYCQDNATTWLDWQAGAAHDPDLPAFVAALLAVRRRFPGLRRESFLTGALDPATGLRDVFWLDPSGRLMADGDWGDPDRRAIGIQLGNEASGDGRVLILINGSGHDLPFRLSPEVPGGTWQPLLDTASSDGTPGPNRPALDAGGTFTVEARSLVLFHHQP